MVVVSGLQRWLLFWKKKNTGLGHLFLVLFGVERGWVGWN